MSCTQKPNGDAMFICEQMPQFNELQYRVAMGLSQDTQFLEKHVWSPIACRHTNWTFNSEQCRVDWHLRPITGSSMETNFAENQRIRDKPDAPLDMCRHIGATHAAYGWARTPDGHWGEAQRQAYFDGFDAAKAAAKRQP